MKAEDGALRRLLPVAALAGFALVAGAFRLRSSDIFWHLAAGRWILENGRLPEGDPFRFTSGDTAWVDHEWLFQVLVRMAEMAGGLPGLQLLRLVLVVLLAGALFAGLRRIGTSIPATVTISLITLLGVRPRLLLRPEILTFIALATLLIGLRRIAARPSVRDALLLGLMVVVWINLHGEAILAPAVSGLYLLGARLQSRWFAEGGSPLAWHWVFGLPALLLLALLVNPFGLHILAVGAGITGAMQGLAAFNPEWLPLWRAPQPFLFSGMAALATLGVFGWWKTRWCHLPTLLVTVAIGGVALSAVRHQALFFLVGAFFCAETWVHLERQGVFAGASRLRADLVAVALCLAATVWLVWPPDSGPLRPRQGRFGLGVGIEPGRFPERAVEFLRQQQQIGPLFNSFFDGGYLIWRLPRRQIFHDGRMELRPELLREIGDARSSNLEWDALLARYGAVGGLVRIDRRRRPVMVMGEDGRTPVPQGDSTANALLFPQESYALVYWDELVMLFLTRAEAAARGLEASEYRYVHPEDVQTTLRRAAADPGYRSGAMGELRRKLVQDPDSDLAKSLLARLTELR